MSNSLRVLNATRFVIAVFAMVAVGCARQTALHRAPTLSLEERPMRTLPLESTTFTAGRVSDYPETGVSRDFKPNYSVFLVRLPDDKLVALSAVDSHLGCIVNWLPDRQQFQDPCHGTRYDMTGVNRIGPGPRPLERFKIYVDGDNVVVDTSVKFQQELGQWKLTDSYIDLAAPRQEQPRTTG